MQKIEKTSSASRLNSLLDKVDHIIYMAHDKKIALKLFKDFVEIIFSDPKEKNNIFHATLCLMFKSQGKKVSNEFKYLFYYLACSDVIRQKLACYDEKINFLNLVHVNDQFGTKDLMHNIFHNMKSENPDPFIPLALRLLSREKFTNVTSKEFDLDKKPHGEYEVEISSYSDYSNSSIILKLIPIWVNILQAHKNKQLAATLIEYLVYNCAICKIDMKIKDVLYIMLHMVKLKYSTFTNEKIDINFDKINQIKCKNGANLLIAAINGLSDFIDQDNRKSDEFAKILLDHELQKIPFINKLANLLELEHSIEKNKTNVDFLKNIKAILNYQLNQTIDNDICVDLTNLNNKSFIETSNAVNILLLIEYNTCADKKLNMFGLSLVNDQTIQNELYKSGLCPEGIKKELEQRDETSKLKELSSDIYESLESYIDIKISQIESELNDLHADIELSAYCN